MTTIEQHVRNLLRATDDVAGWRRAVKELDAAAAVPVVIAILQNDREDAYSRRVAATMLGILGDDRATSALANALNSSDRILRGRAAETLGNFPRLERSIFLRLVEGLKDTDSYFRESSAKALAQLRQPEALAALDEMKTKDVVPFNREVAQEAIAKIRGAR
jgi:HEAT repeat protein